MSERLSEERRLVVLERPAPLWPLLELMLYILIALVTFRLCRRFLIRPLDLKRLEYHRKFLYGPVPLLVGVTLLAEPWDVYAIHLGWRLLAGSFVTVLILIVPASVPRKILLLDDHWRIKYVSYRSRVFRPKGIPQT